MLHNSPFSDISLVQSNRDLMIVLIIYMSVINPISSTDTQLLKLPDKHIQAGFLPLFSCCVLHHEQGQCARVR